MTRRQRPLVALALIASVAAGCGSEAPSKTRTTQKATGADRAVKFSECMRSNAVPDFPDPNAKGEFEYGASVSASVFTRAVRACKDLQPPGSLSSKRTATQQSASLKFADCVRHHGVKDFPDPVNGEPLINTYKIPSSNAPGGMDILNAAIRRCRDDLDEAAAGQ